MLAWTADVEARRFEWLWSGAPHVVPVCLALDGVASYVTVDDPVALATAPAEDATLPRPCRHGTDHEECLACQ